MATIARELEISAPGGANLDEAVLSGIARAKLGNVRYARVKERHVDVSACHITNVRLVVSVVPDD